MLAVGAILCFLTLGGLALMSGNDGSQSEVPQAPTDPTLRSIDDTNSIDTVSEEPVLPAADFWSDNTSGGAPLKVQFFDESNGSPTSWNWNFGDRVTSTKQNPIHTYTTAGVYTVGETVTNEEGKDTEIKTKYITVTSSKDTDTLVDTGSTEKNTDTASRSGGTALTDTASQSTGTAPTADFSASHTTGEAPLKVSFTDESTGSPTEWKWNFGDGSPIIDGTTSAYQNPTHTYEKAGVYEVKETAINSVGRDTETKTGYITVTAPDSTDTTSEPTETAPDADFSADITSGTAPLTVTFTDESTGSSTEWKWNFGDGSPIIDGTTSAYQNPTHTYEKAGVYEVKETAINSVGRDTETKTGYITVTSPEDTGTSVDTGTASEPTETAPVADFSASQTSGEVPLTISFSDESTGSPTEWKWNFGDGSPIIDGTTSAYQNPTHTYEKAGVYEVKETAINSVGRDTEIKTGYITVT
ncbi:PKD domain-containing protein [Methanosarcina mazei]|nr:PKD domain-containing protein [Methanosarcina mazei]KKH03672.1 hypothetical protein DU68_17265 [Methanosarcina mazei]